MAKSELTLWIDKRTCDLDKNRVDYDDYVESLRAEFGDAYELKIHMDHAVSDKDHSESGAITSIGFFGLASANSGQIKDKIEAIFESLRKPENKPGGR